MAHRQHRGKKRGIDDAYLDEAASSERWPRLGRRPHSFPEASFTPSASAAQTTVTTKLPHKRAIQGHANCILYNSTLRIVKSVQDWRGQGKLQRATAPPRVRGSCKGVLQAKGLCLHLLDVLTCGAVCIALALVRLRQRPLPLLGPCIAATPPL